MTILIIMPNRGTSFLVRTLRALEPRHEIRVWPDTGPAEEVEFILTWKHPPGVLTQFPRARAIMSFGAGVDHIMGDPDLPEGVPIVRLLDETLIRDLTEYVLAVVLCRKRHLYTYRGFQGEKKWAPIRDLGGNRIGILGLGRIGSALAARFTSLGFDVYGWDHEFRAIEGVKCYGADDLDGVLSAADYLICTLPLTQKTTHILNLDLFRRCRPEVTIINVGRGGHLAEKDLLKALDEGLVSAAFLDVFETEPLPEDHPFWTHPKIVITPHIAALTNQAEAAKQVLENVRRLEAGEPLLNPVDRERGY